MLVVVSIYSSMFWDFCNNGTREVSGILFVMLTLFKCPCDSESQPEHTETVCVCDLSRKYLQLEWHSLDHIQAKESPLNSIKPNPISNNTSLNSLNSLNFLNSLDFIFGLASNCMPRYQPPKYTWFHQSRYAWLREKLKKKMTHS